MKKTAFISIFSLVFFTAISFTAFAQNIGGPGTTIIPGDPGHAPSDYMHDDTQVPAPVEMTPVSGQKKITEHLLVQQKGIGDSCSAGVASPVSWQLDPNAPVDSKDKLLQVIALAGNSDTRLRQVNLIDDQIDMYYSQPAYFWGFIPMNYNLHISANGTTYHISLDKPKWVGSAKNFHQEATAAFATNVPKLLDSATVETLGKEDLYGRDAKMIEIVSRIMYQVPVSPISNSFFVCFIAPYLVYIILAIALIGIIIWFLIRRLNKETGFKIKKVGMLPGTEDSDEIDHGDVHVTHFKLPKK